MYKKKFSYSSSKKTSRFSSKTKKNYDFNKKPFSKKLNILNKAPVTNAKANYSFFEKRYDRLFGKGVFQQLLQTQKKTLPQQFVRVNLSQTSLEEFEHFLKKQRVSFQKTFLDQGFLIEKSFFNLSSSLPFLSGEAYFQDLASQIPIGLLNFETIKKSFEHKTSPVKVLDMAASPGSKTTQIADLLEYYSITSEITAIECNSQRILRLVNNLQKQNFSQIIILQQEAQKVKLEEKFDLILLDAPCSGNFLDDNTWLNKRSLEGIKEKSQLQKELLQKATSLLSEDGILVYSTCSLEVEENEENVDFTLKKLQLRPYFETKQLDERFTPIKEIQSKKFKLGNSYRVRPEKVQLQGFFVSYFQK